MVLKRLAVFAAANLIKATKRDGLFLCPEALLGASLRKQFALELLKQHML